MNDEKGLRYNANKLMFQLIPPEFEKGIAAVLTQGAKKYASRNWELGLSMDETSGSLKRHLNAYLGGETEDIESKLHHMLHVAVNAMFLYIHDVRGIGRHDIPSHQNKKEEK